MTSVHQIQEDFRSNSLPFDKLRANGFELVQRFHNPYYQLKKDAMNLDRKMMKLDTLDTGCLYSDLKILL